MLNQNLKGLLIEAMNSEIKAKEFYLKASLKAQSNAGKNLFNELANFEHEHYEKVKEIIEALSNDKEIFCNEPCKEIMSVKSEVKGEIEENKDEIINLLNLAIESEKDAQQRYKTISETIEDEEGKKIFDILAQEERNHQRILEDEIYQMSNKGVIIWGE